MEDTQRCFLQAAGKEFFHCFFEQETDKKRICSHGAWNIKRALIILKDYNPDLSLEEIKFNETSFCVCISSLLLGLFNILNALAIAMKIGPVMDVNFLGKEGTWVNYICVKNVNRHIQTPISWSLFIKPHNSQHWVQFQYELLPLPMWMLDHERKDSRQEKPSIVQSPSGLWLKSYGP